MATFEEAGPNAPVTIATRVDKVSPRVRLGGKLRAGAVITVTLVGLIPVLVMVVTAFKTRTDILSSPPLITFQPNLEGFVFLFTERAVVAASRYQEFLARAEAGQLNPWEQIAFESGYEITGHSDAH